MPWTRFESRLKSCKRNAGSGRGRTRGPPARDRSTTSKLPPAPSEIAPSARRPDGRVVRLDRSGTCWPPGSMVTFESYCRPVGACTSQRRRGAAGSSRVAVGGGSSAARRRSPPDTGDKLPATRIRPITTGAGPRYGAGTASLRDPACAPVTCVVSGNHTGHPLVKLEQRRSVGMVIRLRMATLAAYNQQRSSRSLRRGPRPEETAAG